MATGIIEFLSYIWLQLARADLAISRSSYMMRSMGKLNRYFARGSTTRGVATLIALTLLIADGLPWAIAYGVFGEVKPEAFAVAVVFTLVAAFPLSMLYMRAVKRLAQAFDAVAGAAAELGSHRVWLAECQHKYALARAESQSKSTFLAHMSHELRVPLNAIVGFAEIIKDQVFGPIGVPRYQGYAADIHEAAGQVLQAANSILDMSRIEAGRLELRDKVNDVGSVVETAAKAFALTLERNQLKLSCSLQEGLPGLRADPRLLRQMLQNLLSNAVKFTPKRGAIAIKAWSDDAGRISISITDTGIGIAPKEMPTVMEPFGQGKNIDVRRYDGVGLGLPLVKSMVELHGGSFELRSVHHDGTTVTLRFPAERSVAARPVVHATDAVPAVAKAQRRELESATLSPAHVGGA
jgi:signal transduction histidine kinase